MLEPQDETVYLVRLAKLGNREAFARLVQLYESELCGYLNSLLRDPNEAQDCAQQTFLKVWRKLSTLKDETRFRPWLYMIARNVARDCLRRRKKISMQSWEGLEEYSIVESSPALEERATQAELVKLALAELPPKLRACLLLSIWGFSRCEIARILEIGTTSVSTYLCEAHKQFRQAYHRLENE